MKRSNSKSLSDKHFINIKKAYDKFNTYIDWLNFSEKEKIYQKNIHISKNPKYNFEKTTFTIN